MVNLKTGNGLFNPDSYIPDITYCFALTLPAIWMCCTSSAERFNNLSAEESLRA